MKCWNCDYAKVECDKRRQASGEPCCGACDHSEAAEPPTRLREARLEPREVVVAETVAGDAYVLPWADDAGTALMSPRTTTVGSETFLHAERLDDGSIVSLNVRHVLVITERTV